jgi:hypothetical protein
MKYGLTYGGLTPFHRDRICLSAASIGELHLGSDGCGNNAVEIGRNSFSGNF